MVVEMGKGEDKMAATNGQGGWLPPVQSHIKHYSVPAPVHPYIISSTFYNSEQMTHEPFNSKFYLSTKELLIIISYICIVSSWTDIDIDIDMILMY